MDWNRVELKMAGRQRLREARWPCIKATLVFMLLSGLVYGFYNGAQYANKLGILSNTGFLVAILIYVLLIFFVQNPLGVGAVKFFLNVGTDHGESVGVTSVFRDGTYGNAVKVLFLQTLYVALWSILFVVPGIMKAYSYRMVPYLLAEHPDITPKDAFAQSTEMMNGHRWKTFVLDISFFGWWLLSIFSLGILAVVFVIPYQMLVYAGLYRALNGGDMFDLWLVCMGGPLMGSVYPITGDQPISIGRFATSVVRYPPDYRTISREHAQLYWDGNALMLTDCGSYGGTFLNDSDRLIPMQPREVRPGDKFFLSDSKNLFEIRS